MMYMLCMAWLFKKIKLIQKRIIFIKNIEIKIEIYNI